MDEPQTPTSPPSCGFRTPPRILIPKLVESRDKWKEKAGQRKRQLKAAQIRTRDLSTSRALWKDRAVAAEQQVQDLQRQLQEAQRLLELSRSDIAELRDQAQKK
jgi:hypothetical protein